jgi:hypothetical protein
MSDYLPLPNKVTDRTKGAKYMYKDNIVIWGHNSRLNCEHNRVRSSCKECGGNSMCEHNRERRRCKECGGSGMCKHNRRKELCKECGGSGICEHNRERFQCIECGGGGICEHNRVRSSCKECGGSQICEHDKIKHSCKECGGSQICKHDKIRSRCKQCEGGSICEHNTRRSYCKECNPNGYLTHIIRSRVRGSLKNYNTRKDQHTMEYIGCSVEDLRNHLENQFENETERCGHPISWENQGEWHIDHIRPCASFDLDLEDERHKCFHYTNLQPMWGPDNISKSDTYNEDEDEREWDGEKWIYN